MARLFAMKALLAGLPADGRKVSTAISAEFLKTI
jgi:hypothetical protein